ncbi:hypothetical protein [Changpingibacter yushuensis]|uniref:hypothetical protein n=1 Tax=Changpingibacter yushuensis TaxID=2758440 RepID=UPI0015F6D27B|nr:hypothetical protein [Changpingibacter yushuensis]
MTDYPKAPANPLDLITDEFGFQMCMMTPEVADVWLREFNNHNRPLSAPVVKTLASTIENGEWKLTHQGIAIDKDINLIDGQHRLAAIVSSDTTIPIMITWGVDPDVFDVIDTGRRRSGTDALALSEFSFPNQNLVASVTKLLTIRRTRTLESFSTSAIHLTNAQLLSRLRELNLEVMEASVPIGQRFHLLGATSVGAFTYDALCAGAPVNVICDEFLTPVAKRVGLRSQSDPRYALSSYIDRSKNRRNNDRTRADVYATMCKAWNAWVRGQDRSIFRDPNAWVDIVGLPDRQTRSHP